MNEKEFSPKQNKIEITSMEGITLYKFGGRIIINMPIKVYEKIGGRETIGKELFPHVFGGSSYAWAEEFEDSFSVELPRYATQEQTQQFVDEIEKRFRE